MQLSLILSFIYNFPKLLPWEITKEVDWRAERILPDQLVQHSLSTDEEIEILKFDY